MTKVFGKFFSEIAPWGDIQEHKRRIFRLIIGRPSALKKELPNVFTSSPRMTFQIFCLAKLNICLKKSFTVKNPFHFICQMSKRMWSANLWNYKLPPTCIRHTGPKWKFSTKNCMHENSKVCFIFCEFKVIKKPKQNDQK